jgi:SAM-dependent methyltransferase
MGNKVDFDNYTDNYNDLLHEVTRFFSSDDEYFAQYKIDIVKKQIHSPVKRVLEYGCGIGRNIKFLQSAFPDANIVGTDISQASLEIAQHDNADVEFILENDDLESIGLFDVILVAGVFHHVPVSQRIDVAMTLLRRLSPDGVMFVFEHNPFNPITRRIVNNCVYDEDAVLLKPSELRQLLNHAAFTVERQSYCLFIPPQLSILLPLEDWLAWIPLGGQYWTQARRAL